MSEVVNSKLFFFIGPQNYTSGIQWTITFRKPFNINNVNNKKKTATIFKYIYVYRINRSNSQYRINDFSRIPNDSKILDVLTYLLILKLSLK